MEISVSQSVTDILCETLFVPCIKIWERVFSFIPYFTTSLSYLFIPKVFSYCTVICPLEPNKVEKFYPGKFFDTGGRGWLKKKLPPSTPFSKGRFHWVHSLLVHFLSRVFSFLSRIRGDTSYQWWTLRFAVSLIWYRRGFRCLPRLLNQWREGSYDPCFVKPPFHQFVA